MAFFGKRRQTPPQRTFDITMAMVQAAMAEDAQALTSLSQRLEPIDVFADLADFYANVTPRLTPEQKEMIRREIDAVDGPPAVKTAVHDIGLPLFLELDPQAVATQITLHGKASVNGPGNLWADITMETIFVASRINQALDITMNWSSR